MPKTIAIVEDEAAIRANYADALRKQGYQVQAYGDRPEALAAFDRHLPDLVIIDIALGDEIEGGFELCRQVRSRSESLPVIFLTARDSDLDTITGLRLGADDYLTKDISLPHLTARIAALFRRMEALRTCDSPEQTIHHGELSLDMSRMAVVWRDEPVTLTITELWMLHGLVRYPGHVKSREQLMQEANIVVDDATVTSHIKRIRRKFANVDAEFACIETVYGMGYRWTCPS